jgi:hypothetical protein
MKWILFSFFVMTNAIAPKLCIDCKHFIKNGVYDEFGKCAFYPILDDNDFLSKMFHKRKRSNYLAAAT